MQDLPGYHDDDDDDDEDGPQKAPFARSTLWATPGGIEGAGEVVAAEAVRYELFERKAISWAEGAGRVRYRKARVVYDVHESGPGRRPTTSPATRGSRPPPPPSSSRSRRSPTNSSGDSRA
jgi:hypothetical protein